MDDTFRIKSGSNNFLSKQKSIFDVLANVEKEVKLAQNDSPMEVDHSDSRHRNKKNRNKTKALRGQESLFKKPAPVPMRNRIPDFRRNPRRWTKYTLADVSPDAMSEAGNTAAAMDFLRTVRAEKEAVESGSENQKITFKKRKGQRIPTNDVEPVTTSPSKSKVGFGDACEPVEVLSNEKAKYTEGKLVMPEYVVGEKISKAKKNKDTIIRGKELKLSHLQDYEDD